MDLDSSSESNCAPSVGWNGKPITQRVWRRECKTGSLSRLQSTVTCDPLTVSHGLESWILSLRDSPASPFRWLARSKETRTPGTSGRTSPGSSESADRQLSSWRTCEDSSTEDSSKSWKTFPASGSMRNGIFLARKRRERLTAGRGSSCLPTPMGRDWKRNGGQQRRHSKNLPDIVLGTPNPVWVEWLMGLPMGHTGLDPLETGLFQRWLLEHSGS